MMPSENDRTPDEEAASAKRPARPKKPKSDAAPKRPSEPSPANVRRHEARELALQTLYEVDMTDHSAAEVLSRTRSQLQPDQETFEYLELLIGEFNLIGDEVDGYIGVAAPAFPVAQLANVDRNVLRIATIELLRHPDVPAKVAISEAIVIAKRFGGDNSSRFVNGALGAIYRKIQAERAAATATGALRNDPAPA